MRSGISVWKRMRDNLSVAIVFVAALLFLILTLSGKVFANDQIVPDDRNKLNEGNLYVGFPGTYVIDEYEEAKALINQYRKEAGDYNVTVSIMGSITSVLSPENVNEVKLSSSLEKCAQVRAAEASFMLDHTRPRQPGDQDSGDGSLSNCDSSFFSGFESLYAYGNMISAVKAFYEEKKTFDSYIQNATTDKSGVKKVEISAQQFPSVGHYLSMILPEYQYFGIGTFKLDGRNYYATAAEFYKTWPKEYEAYGYETMPKDIIVSPAGVTGHVIQKIEANSKRTTLDLSAEDDSFEMGETMILSPTAVIKSVNGKRSKDLVVYGGLTWLSSDDSVGKVNESGTVSALKPGEVKITASCGEASAEKVLNVTKVSLSSASVILSDSVYTYDGIPKKPGVTVTIKGVTLTEGSDYTVSYENNENAGTAQVVITAIESGNYKDSCRKEFTITSAPLENYEIESIPAQTYTGEPIIPQVTVSKTGGAALVQGRDYTVTVQDNTNAGNAEVTVTGKQNYTGTLTGKFTINKVNLETNANVRIATIPDLIYTGSAREPKVLITYLTDELNLETDYSVEYSENTNAGNAVAIVKGLGNYEGSRKLTFKINPAELTKLEGISSKVYSGAELSQDNLIVKAGDLTVGKTDYSVEYTNNVDVGTAEVSVVGKGNFIGTCTGTFSVLPANLSDGNISGLTDKEYSGLQIKEIPLVSVNGRTLNNNTDYTLTYDGDLVNAGIIKVTATGKGNYTGELVQTYSIQPRDIFGEANIKEIESVTYTGQPHTPETIVKIGENTLVRDADYEVSYVDNIDAGSASVVVTGIGNYTGTAEQVFTISPADLTEAEITPQACIYTGAPVTAVLSVHLNGAELQETTDYTVSYVSGQDYTKTGQPAVKVVGCGNYTGEKETAINISPADISTVIVSAPDQTWTGSELRPAVTVKLNGRVLPAEDYTVEYHQAHLQFFRGLLQMRR